MIPRPGPLPPFMRPERAAEPERARRPRASRAAHAQLRSLVARDYAGHADDTGGHHLVLPATAAVPLILKLADSPFRPPEFAMGVHDAYEAVEGACAPAYLEVWLAPLGAYSLLGLPMDELAGATVDLVDLLGPDAHRAAERVRDAGSWDDRFRLVDDLLLGRLERGTRPAPEVARAWHVLVAGGGTTPIGEVAREVGWSHKHLITRFRQQIGMAPKTAARLIRLDRVWRSLGRPGPRSWAEIAAEAGYADQAHLIRDFRRFTGTTPADFQSWSDGARRRAA